MELFEKTKSTREIYKGRIFSLKEDTVELPDGSETLRDVVLHNGGVGVIAVTEDGKIPLVRQYRKGIERVTLEIPAGKLEIGEDPESCGRRELIEETGYEAEIFNKVISIAPTPAYCSEIIHIFRAEKLKKAQQKLDADEFLNVEYYDINDILKMIESGGIIDAKTVAAILLEKNMRR